MPLSVYVPFIIAAMYQRDKEDLWLVWSAAYPHFDDKSFISFTEFCDKSLGVQTKISDTPREKMFKDAEDILKKIRGE